MKLLFKLFPAVLLLCFSCGQSTTSTPAESEVEEVAAPEVESFVPKALTEEDSTYFQSLIDELKGIEKFAVGERYDMLSSLLGHKDQTEAHERTKAILSKFSEYPHRFDIMDLDTKNGYIVYAPFGAEVTYTEVYWNLKDGSQLLATESWGCGPICESEISFRKYQNGNYEDLEVIEVIPEIGDLPPMIDASGDPVEYQFVLPKQGKDMKYCLESDCITLKWMDGTFKIVK